MRERIVVSSTEEAVTTVIQVQPKRRRRRFQHGSVQKRKSGKNWLWIGYWWDDEGIRRAKTLGSCRELTRGEAETKLADLIQPVNAKSSEPKRRQWTLKAFIEDSYFPFSRRRWKKSTVETTEDRIRYHLIGDLGKKDMASFRREHLQL